MKDCDFIGPTIHQFSNASHRKLFCSLYKTNFVTSFKPSLLQVCESVSHI